jgi:hypothetical protein
MAEKYVYLMSVYNEIEAENVMGVLEMEGIKAVLRCRGREEFMNVANGNGTCSDIMVHDYAYEDARCAIETEMVRGDF